MVVRRSPGLRVFVRHSPAASGTPGANPGTPRASRTLRIAVCRLMVEELCRKFCDWRVITYEKVKNINPVEQHVEKGIPGDGCAYLAAGFLGYSALSSPLKFTDGYGRMRFLGEGCGGSRSSQKVERDEQLCAGARIAHW